MTIGGLITAGVTAAVLYVGSGAASAEVAEVMTWKIGADVRQAVVYAPASTSKGGKAPLVLSFHGHGDNVQNFQHTDMHRAWPEAVVVYFQGLPSRRDGLSGWQVEKNQDEDRDLKLVDAALASLREKFKVDDARIYSTGFSNGAGFTYLLWAERPDVFAAFAPVAGRFRPSVRPSQPRPILHIAGRRDRQIPFADQEAAIETDVRVDGVGGRSAPCGEGCTIYGEGSKAPVMTWIHQGGHDYPQGTSERIAKFFRDYPH
jgi:polyhydroxybutyrate depolymerase